MNTGGGSGETEDFRENMNQGEADEAFTKYGPWVGNRDDLAWVYMVDKEIGFAFNMVNDPAPAGSVMEDGESRMVSSQSTKQYNKQPDDQHKICSTMKDGFDMISQLLLPEGTRKGEETDGLERIVFSAELDFPYAVVYIHYALCYICPSEKCEEYRAQEYPPCL